MEGLLPFICTHQNAAASDAAGERLFSGECEALGRHMTHINHDTITARLILRGKHAINPLDESSIVSWAKEWPNLVHY